MKTHILKDQKWTFCGYVGRGPHSTVYAVDRKAVLLWPPLLPVNKETICKRCLNSHEKETKP